MERDEYEKLAFLEDTCGWNIGRRRILESALRSHIQKPEGLNILEVGCGTGGNAQFLKKFGRLTGLDSNEIALGYASGKGFDELVKGSVESLPFMDGTFDVVASLDMLEHIADDSTALREIFRVLKKDGVLLLTVPAHAWLWTQHDVALHHHRRYTSKGLAEKVHGAGFNISKLSQFVIPTVPYLMTRGLMDKLRGRAGRGEANSYYAPLPWAVNKGFALWLEMERLFLKVANIPLGGSILMVAKKEAVVERSSTASQSIFAAACLMAGTLFLYIATAVPSLFHNDAFDFARSAMLWARTGAYHAAHWPDYPGWLSLLALTFKANSSAASDAFSFILGAKYLGIFFTALAAVGMYLVAQKIFSKPAFSLMIAAVFAINPTIWHWGQSGMSDVPALSLMLFSFLLFLDFYCSRSVSRLVLSSILVGAAALVRLQSLMIMLPYLVGIFFIAIESTARATERLKMILRYGAIAGVFASIMPLMAYGLPWNFAHKGPSPFPGLFDLMGTIKWYVARDVGAVWFAFASVGLVIGMANRKTRPFAAMLLAGIAAGIIHIADWYSKTGGDTDRYLIPTIPFTLLGIGFLWNVARSALVKSAVSAYAIVYFLCVLIGFQYPDIRMLESATLKEKMTLMPYLQASRSRLIYEKAAQTMAVENALASALPTGVKLLAPVQDWSVTPFFVDAYNKTGQGMIWVDDREIVSSWIKEVSALAPGSVLAIHPELKDPDVLKSLQENGFVPIGNVSGALLFESAPTK